MPDKSINKIVKAFLDDYIQDLETQLEGVLKKLIEKERQSLLLVIEEKAKIKLSDLKGERGDPGKDGIKPILGVDYSIPAPIPGEPGRDADEAKIIADVLKQLPDPIPGLPGAPGKDGTEILGEEIVDKINILPTDDESKKIDAKHIKNLPKTIEKMSGIITRGGGEQIRIVTLSSQLNGSTKTFSLSSNVIEVSALIGSEAPIIYEPTDHFTYTQTTVTLTASVTAPSAGSVLLAVCRLV